MSTIRTLPFSIPEDAKNKHSLLPVIHSELVADYSALDLALPNGGSVKTWTPSIDSRQEYVLKQAVVAEQPVYVSSLDGAPAVRFNSAKVSSLSTDFTVNDLHMPLTVTAQVKLVEYHTSYFLYGGIVGTQTHFLQAHFVNSGYVSMAAPGVNNYTNGTQGAYANPTDWHTISWVYDYGRSKIYLDGVKIADGSSLSDSDPTTAYLPRISIGKAGNTSPFNGWVRHLRFNNRAWSDQDAAEAHNYLQNKYAS